MLKNHLKIAWRNVKKYPAHTFQNLLGLSVALAVAILSIAYIMKELSFDKYYENSNRIFRVNTDIKIGDQETNTATSSDVLGPLLAESFLQIESYVRFFTFDEPFGVRKGDKFVKEIHGVFADSSLFTVFNIPIIEETSARFGPNTVIITKSIANKYFGDQKAIGQIIELDGVPHSTLNIGSYKVTAVIPDFKENSHLGFDFIFPISNLEYTWGKNYAGSYFHTYVLLKKEADYRLVNQGLQAMAESKMYPMVSEQMGISQTWKEFVKSGNKLAYNLFPMTDIHLYSNREGELGQNGDIQTLYILTALMLFVLLMASFNYVNLSTARAVCRIREVGLRKVMGSSRFSIIIQFLSETIIMVAMSTIVALLIAVLVLPYFNTILSTSITLTDIIRLSILLIVFFLSLFVGLMSGIYPAFFLSNVKITSTVKGSHNSIVGESNLRRPLIVFQLTISIILIVGTLTVYKQLSHIKQVELGYNKDQVIVVNNITSLDDNIKTFKQEVSNVAGIISTSLTGSIPVNSSKLLGNYSKERVGGDISAVPMRTWWVDENYFETMGIPILQGNNFSEIPVNNNGKIIINEEAVKLLGLDNPVGQKIYADDSLAYIIVGVVKNFNYESLREKIGPVFFNYTQGSSASFAAIRFSSHADIGSVLGSINKVWADLNPRDAIDYYFLDEAFNAMYHNDQIIGKIGLAVATLAVIIACIGLLAMIAYTSERRTKEIGIRKVFGASVYSILRMLTTDIIVLVFLSLLIASPIAWWAMNQWLDDFAYRIEIQWWMFALAGTLAVIIALLAVSFQAVKAAVANPVNSLRDE